MTRLTDIRHLWATVARDLVMLTLPQPVAETAVSLDGVRAHYRLSEGELSDLLRLPEFQKILKREAEQAEALGRRAAHVLRASELAAGAAEKLYEKLNDPDTSLGDMVKAYVALARSAGLDEIPEAKTSGPTQQMAIQINLPRLSNPKLNHVRILAPAEGAA